MTDLKAPFGPLAFYLDLKPALSDFRQDVIDGFSKSQKSLSPIYFYDEVGSRIFEEITRLEAYYPTRTEREIMETRASDISDAIGAGVAVLEYGAGAPDKIRRLLSLMDAPVSYVAIDISGDHLVDGMSQLARDLETLPIGAICADFGADIKIPGDILPPAQSWLGYFPGSTLGNMTPSRRN